MKKQILLKFLNIVLLLAFVTVALSMILYRWGPESIRWSESMYEIHETSGMVFFFMVILHFVFNWTWVRNTYFKKKN